MVRPLPHDRTRARRDRRRDGRQGQDREAQRRREPEDRVEIWRDVDPDPDDLQGRRNGLPPGLRGAEGEAAAVDHFRGLIRLAQEYFWKRPAKAGRFALMGHVQRMMSPACCLLLPQNARESRTPSWRWRRARST